MIEIFILYDKTTGFLTGGGRLNRERDLANPDGSTATENINRILSNDSNYDVLYLPNQPLPDRRIGHSTS